MSSVDIRVVYFNIRYKANELMAIPKKKYENLYKTALCNSVKSNTKCTFGDKCNFAHSTSELKQRKCLFGPACTKDYCNLLHEEIDPSEYLDKLIKEIEDYKKSVIVAPVIKKPDTTESFIINLDEEEDEDQEEDEEDEDQVEVEEQKQETVSSKKIFEVGKTPLIECEQDVYDFLKWECEQEKLEREQKDELNDFSLPPSAVKENNLSERYLSDVRTPFSSPLFTSNLGLSSNMLNSLQKQTISNLTSQNTQLQIELFNAYAENKKQQDRIYDLETCLLKYFYLLGKAVGLEY